MYESDSLNADDARVVHGLKRLLLAARPISAENPPVLEADNINTQAKTGVHKELTREQFSNPKSVAIEIPGSDLDAFNPVGDSTIQMQLALKKLGVPNDRWDMAYIVKDSRKAGLRVLIDKDSYRAVARTAAWRMLSDDKMPAELGYDREQFNTLLNRTNSLPYKIIINAIEQGEITPDELPKFMLAAAKADHHELAAEFRDRIQAGKTDKISELTKGGSRKPGDRRAEDEKCEGRGGFGSGKS